MSAFRRVRHEISRKGLSIPLTWLRHRGLGSEDVFVAAYPRSGSTWLRFLLVEILTGEKAEFDNLNRVIPEVGIHSRAMSFLPDGGRLVKTHEPYRREYKKAIYLVRDVRDVVLSNFSRVKQLRLFPRTDFDAFLESFLRGKLPRGAWHNHVDGWLEAPPANNGHMLVIRFEDMRQNTEATCAQILEFLGVYVEPKVIRDAIANNCLEKMRAKEDRDQKLPKSSREDGRFVREGSVGGWRRKLTETHVRLIEQYAGRTLARMGYVVGSGVAVSQDQELAGGRGTQELA